jgi:hypothetical protein
MSGGRVVRAATTVGSVLRLFSPSILIFSSYILSHREWDKERPTSKMISLRTRGTHERLMNRRAAKNIAPLTFKKSTLLAINQR